jgi:hypothetical protein
MGDVASSSQALPLRLPLPRSLPNGWASVAALLIVGYLCMGRSFAYVGLPWFSLYIGELALGAFLLFGPQTKQGRWLRVAQRARRLRRFEWLLLLLLCYGGFESLRGIFDGYPVFTAVRDTAYDYYPLFLFLGMWLGLRDRGLLRRVARTVAWWNGCYGVAYLLLLSRLSLTMPGTVGAGSIVPLFSEPYNGSAIALLGLLAFEPRLRQAWYLIALNAFVLLGVQVRAEWLAFAVGLLVFAWCTKRIKHVAMAGSIFVVLLGLMYVMHVNLPSPKGRGGEISVDYIVARAVAPLNKTAASNLASAKQAHFFAGTAEWRLVWWAAIWARVHTSMSSALFGFGYGYPIGDLNPLIPAGDFIQTPHNDFFYALAFCGWLGVALFVLLQVEVLRLLWRSYRITGQPFGLMCWAALLTASMFEDFFEAPFGAIPFFLLVGMALAPAILARESAADLVLADCPTLDIMRVRQARRRGAKSQG